MPCMRFVVRGRVQGVFFRASAREQALRLGITGHARNRADGSVEVIACGEATALAELERWLGTGPRHARVSGVEAAPVDMPAPERFETG